MDTHEPVRYYVVHIPRLLVALGLAKSRTEAERLLKAGAVEIKREPDEHSRETAER